MKKYKFMGRFLPVLLISAMFYSCDNSTDPTPPLEDGTLPAIDVSWDSTNSIVCFGTSLTYGYVPDVVISKDASGSIIEPEFDPDVVYPDTSYPKLLGERLKIKVYNQGYVGYRTDQGLALVEDSVLSKKPALVFLEFGANDFFQHVPAAQMKANLNTLIGTLKAGGAKVALLSFINPDMANFLSQVDTTGYNLEEALAYYEALKSCAEENGIPFMDRLFQDIWTDLSKMSPDYVHPNRKGYAQMYLNVYEAFKLTFEKNGMLK